MTLITLYVQIKIFQKCDGQISENPDKNKRTSTITVVEENGKGCIDYHDTKGEDRQDPIL